MAFEKIIPLGMILIFIGFLLVFTGSLSKALIGSKEKTSVKSAGIVFIGPFPFGWASDKETFYWLLGIMILVLMFWLIFLKRG